jgi:hypothetical protein
MACSTSASMNEGRVIMHQCPCVPGGQETTYYTQRHRTAYNSSTVAGRDEECMARSLKTVGGLEEGGDTREGSSDRQTPNQECLAPARFDHPFLSPFFFLTPGRANATIAGGWPSCSIPSVRSTVVSSCLSSQTARQASTAADASASQKDIYTVVILSRYFLIYA